MPQSARRTPLTTPPRAAAVTVWLAAEIILALHDRTNALVAVGFVAYLACVYAITARIIHSSDVLDHDVLNAEQPRRSLAVRTVIVGATFLIACAFVFDRSGSATFGWLSVFFAWLARALPWIHGSVLNFTVYALVPGILVLSLGARPRALGIATPVRGTLLAGILSTGIFVASWFYRIARGAISPQWAIAELVRNFLSNGFSEEFLFRGLIFSHLRALVRTDWALVLSALCFSLFHLGSSMHDESTAIGVLANVVALNFPLGWTMGLITVRTRSLALPTAIHLSLDMTRHVWA